MVSEKLSFKEKIAYALGDAAAGQAVVNIDEGCLPAVQKMIWAIFSIIPAFIALIMIVLVKLYPIKK